MNQYMALLSIKILKHAVRNGTKPVPLREYQTLHQEAVENLPFADPVFKLMPFVHADGTHLANPRLREVLGSRPLGDSALATASLNYLEELVANLKPASVLEFGSGVSTLALRLFLNERVGSEVPLFSIDQSRHYLDKTRAELVAVGLSRSVHFLHAPLKKAVVCGRRVDVYDLAWLEHLLKGRRPELVLVDGPLGVPGSRVHVLPSISSLISPKAVILLDDATRDGETWIAEQWAQLPGFAVQGVIMVGKGFLYVTLSGRSA